MRSIVIALALCTAVAAAADYPEVKSTTMITVSAAHLTEPFEIVDEFVLARSNVYAGAFIGEIAPPPGATLPRYTLTFDIQTLDGIKKAAYTVQYSVDSATGEGFVYLPGPGDAEHRRNISTILRQGHDGRWHRATDDWNAVVYPFVRR